MLGIVNGMFVLNRACQIVIFSRIFLIKLNEK